MSIQKLVLTFFAGASGSLGLLVAQTTATSITRQINFPPVGVALTETIQVNLWNQSSNASSGAAACAGSVAFINATGKAISGAGGSYTAPSGQIVSANLTGANAGSGSGARAEIRAVIMVEQSVPLALGCALSASVETFDTVSGETHVYISQPVAGLLAPVVPFAPAH